ncbi:receptor-type tyrosine-protein phosphatase T-like [Anneissia japonica]|uniref:receptor-type tyrosine-protein phosphatase T-like n=1 Tax=Anneissia japonica TaxID=1529436 RepID=UPI001425704F|nr:receptor-type tyrosine-protein phosphatase T-like [Anneissia japonica]
MLCLPFPVPGVPEIISAEYFGGSINVEWHPPVNIQCPVSYSVILQCCDEKTFSKDTNDTQVTFTVEDGISPDKNYTVKVAAITMKGLGNYSAIQAVKVNETQNTQGPNKQIQIVIGIVGSVVAILVFITLTYYLRRRQKGKQEDHQSPILKYQPEVNNAAGAEKGDNVRIRTNIKQPVCNENIDIEPVYENTDIPSRDIPLKELHAYVMMKRSNSVDSMKKEFEDLGTKQRHSWDVAKHSDNKTKNRYANVVTYDKSRVILKLDGSTAGSDYINASYIDVIL